LLGRRDRDLSRGGKPMIFERCLANFLVRHGVESGDPIGVAMIADPP
jgi:hypothetical protein